MLAGTLILVTDHAILLTTCQIINYYRDVDAPSLLHTLLSLDLNSTIPTLLINHFNLHLPSWSPQGLSRLFKAGAFEPWLVGQIFELVSPSSDAGGKSNGSTC